MVWASKVGGVLLFLLFSPLLATKPDTEIWQQTLVRFPTQENIQWTVKAGFRWNQHASHLYHQYGETGFLISKPRCWDLFPSFRLSLFRFNENRWLVDNNPRLTFHKYWWIDQMRLVNRSRFEYTSLANAGIYRNRMDVQIFSRPTEKSFGAYLSEELFFSTRRVFYEFRVQSGFLIPYTDWLESDVAYLFRLTKIRGVWQRANIMTFYFNFSF